MRSNHFLAASLSAILAAGVLAPALAQKAPAKIDAAANKKAHEEARQGEAEFKALYKELIETNTTLSVGSCTKAAEQIKARLQAAGYPPVTTEIVHPAPQFHYAEDYHQQYLAKNPGGYCGLGGTGVSCSA